MADSGSKGNKKRNSELQKAHYKAHYFKLADNKLKKLRRYIMRNLRQVEKKQKKGRQIAIDEQAVNRYKALGGKLGDDVLKRLAAMSY